MRYYSSQANKNRSFTVLIIVHSHIYLFDSDLIQLPVVLTPWSDTIWNARIGPKLTLYNIPCCMYVSTYEYVYEYVYDMYACVCVCLWDGLTCLFALALFFGTLTDHITNTTLLHNIQLYT